MPQRRKQLNPAFAKAHGVGTRKTIHHIKNGDDDSTEKIDAALRSARSSARLNLSSCSLDVSSLPDEMFDLRGSVQINLAMDSIDNPGAWESISEDQIVSLDISDNHHATNPSNRCHLDSRLQKLLSLQTLRARRSDISSVFWGFMYQFSELVILDLSGNHLQVAMLEYLPISMREVDLSKNNLACLIDPKDVDNEPIIVLPNLTRLNVSKNKITAFPRTMEVTSLQVLCFSNNHIADLSSSNIINQCYKTLVTLEGSNNQLETLPDLSQCPKLTTMELGDNLLCRAPSISNSVVRLSLNNNSISTISDLLGGMKLDSNINCSLVELRLRGNKLTELEENTVRYLANVTCIDVGENDLRDVPNALGFLPQLRSLQLDGNPMRTIRTPLLQDTGALKSFLRNRCPLTSGKINFTANTTPIPTSNKAKSLVTSALVGTFTLDLSGKELESLPVDVGNELLLPNVYTESDDSGFVGARIRRLNVSQNALSNLDDWLSAMPNIVNLNACRNQMVSLPHFIGDIPLVELHIARNDITSVALAKSLACIRKFSSLAMSLQYLDLSGNAIEWLPSGLSKLPSLTTLLLANNSIETLAIDSKGDGIESGWPKGGFKSLETLNLSNNRLSDLEDLPHCLASDCPFLRSLSLANNELTVIPPTLGLIKNLMSIDLRGNPQRGMRMNIFDREAPEVLLYLRNKLDIQEIQSFKSNVLGSDENQADQSTISVGIKVEELKRSIREISLQLNNVYLTEAQKNSMKETLEMNKATLIKEERTLSMMNNSY